MWDEVTLTSSASLNPNWLAAKPLVDRTFGARKVSRHAMQFTPREVDEELARRYVREGFWRDESLGALLAAGLHDASAHPFTVRSERKPFRGTLGHVDELARRMA